ncbi:hypothetical protein [Capnocytophaga canimorsus]|uniref:hypothetical protein n=1 Tax=Capnocytophaga canimorsus TaxID=28188 RepID=UPI0037D4353E
MEKDILQFNIHAVNLLEEITNNALPREMGVLRIPINLFQGLLAQVAQRATELNDPKMNILMLRLGLYEVAPEDIRKMIEQQEKLLENDTTFQNQN